MEQEWNGYGTDTQLNMTFQVLHSIVWNGGVWNGGVWKGIRELDPELWIGMCARPCSGPFILSGSHIFLRPHGRNPHMKACYASEALPWSLYCQLCSSSMFGSRPRRYRQQLVGLGHVSSFGSLSKS